MSDLSNIESLLARALAPVEPPEDLANRMEATLAELTDLAAEELEGWELGAMRDPRNWARPVAAVAVGTTAGAALVLLRVRQQHRRRAKHADNPLELARETLEAVADETRRLLDR